MGQALITTAAGITVALLTLLPYNLFRAQADRALSRLESLVAAALSRADR
ncbi:MAG: MotA/TolQ/ExbB proton channel family protein [Planctomycetota bacterium]